MDEEGEGRRGLELSPPALPEKVGNEGTLMEGEM